jgi:hypothetical protein
MPRGASLEPRKRRGFTLNPRPRGAAPWNPAKGSGPWNHSFWVGNGRGPDRDLSRSVSALSHSPPNGQIAKGLARSLPSRLSRGLEVQEAKPPGFAKGEALALRRFNRYQPTSPATESATCCPKPSCSTSMTH